MPDKVQMHGTAIVGDRFYVFGGEIFEYGWSNKVKSAEIGADAQLRNWREETPLPMHMAYLTNCVEVVNGCIYMMGFLRAESATAAESKLQRSRNVVWGRVGPDGRISQWNVSSYGGMSTSVGATCSTDKHLYFTGGTAGSLALNKVFMAEFASDGQPVNWREVALLPGTRWYHAAAVQKNRLYIWSGLPDRSRDRSKAEESVFSAPINADGTLGPWRNEASMTRPVYSSGGCALNDFLVSVGGRYANGYPTNVIWTTCLQGDRVTGWTMLNTDLQSRVYHSLAMDKNKGLVFISGGRDKTVPGTQGGNYLDVVQGFLLK